MMKRKVSEHQNNREERKKFRIETPSPSKVIHIRNLPDRISELDVASIAIPFGLITYMVVTRKNAQALIEMEAREVAEAMFDYYQQHSPHLQNKRCFINYSIHNSLQYPDSSMHPEAEAAVAAANQMSELMANEPSASVLRIIIDEWNNERITYLDIYKVFHHYGTIERIVSYIHKGVVQGFIQYADPFSAKVALAITNNLCLFPNCCPMKVTFSNRKTLEISRENEMVRDFVKHPVTPLELKHFNDSANGSSSSRYVESSRSSRDAIDTLATLQPLLSQAVDYPEDATHLLRSLAPRIRELLNDSSDFRDSVDIYDRGRMDRGHSNFGERTSPLLIVSNLNESKVNPDALFKLFGCYGDVTRVKIMYNRKNTALIQFVSDEHAQRALQYLNGINLYGKPIHANFSKHDRISQPAPTSSNDNEPGGDSLHRDYSDHKLHRYKRASSRNHLNIFEPSRVLHVAGLVDEVTEEDVEAIFQDHQFRVRKIRMMTRNGKNMALVEMSSVESAVEALIALHDFDLCGSHLRVSFSKGAP